LFRQIIFNAFTFPGTAFLITFPISCILLNRWFQLNSLSYCKRFWAGCNYTDRQTTCFGCLLTTFITFPEYFLSFILQRDLIRFKPFTCFFVVCFLKKFNFTLLANAECHLRNKTQNMYLNLRRGKFPSLPYMFSHSTWLRFGCWNYTKLPINNFIINKAQ
jgi:hypothetical protein